MRCDKCWFLVESDYVFSKQKPSDLKACDGKSDATYWYNDEIIIPIEFKRQLFLENKGQLDYDDSNTKDVVGQIYSCMAEFSYSMENWFLFRPKNNLTILKILRTILLDSTSLTVLKVYVTNLTRDDPKSHNCQLN